MKNSFVNILLKLDRYDEALAVAEKIIASKRKCTHVPRSTYGNVLEHLYKRGEYEKALHYHHCGMRLLRKDKNSATDSGSYILFAAQMGRDEEVIKLMEHHFCNALTCPGSWGRMCFFTNVASAMEILATRGQRTLPIHVPNAPWGQQLPDIDMVRARAKEKATRLALAYDRRNGNDHVSRVFQLNVSDLV